MGRIEFVLQEKQSHKRYFINGYDYRWGHNDCNYELLLS